MNDKFKFKLCEELAVNDELGPDYEYTAIKHPEADDLFCIQFCRHGKWDAVNYEDKVVRENIEKGMWIMTI